MMKMMVVIMISKIFLRIFKIIVKIGVGFDKVLNEIKWLSKC